MRHCKVEHGVVVQVQGKPQQGFIECPPKTVPGMRYSNGVFTTPPPTPPTQEELDEAEDRATVKSNTEIRALVRMRPAEIEAWAGTNVKTLPDAKDLLIRLTKVVAMLAKREFG